MRWCPPVHQNLYLTKQRTKWQRNNHVAFARFNLLRNWCFLLFVLLSTNLPVFQGHMKSIQCVTVHRNEGGPCIYSGSHDGHINILGLIKVTEQWQKNNMKYWLRRRLLSTFLPHLLSSPTVNLSLAVASHYWNADNGDSDCFSGKGHTNQVSSMAINENDELVSCGMDDTLRFTNLKKKEYRSACLCATSFMLTCCAWIVNWRGWHGLKFWVIRVPEGQTPAFLFFFFLIHEWSWLVWKHIAFTG